MSAEPAEPAEPHRPPERRAWLGLGGNLGDVPATIRAALARLGASPGVAVAAVSSFYRTPPWGDLDQPPFVNAAAALETSIAPGALLRLCLETEVALGRVRGRRWGPRPIDLDILAVQGVVSADPDLTLPHPRLTQRAFALAPLAEIAPELVVADRSVAEWLARADRTGVVRL